jgi:beta-aspartyl-peptidase (threonine type)
MTDKSAPTVKAPANANYVLVCHGGAGTMSRAGSTPEQRVAYRAGIRTALEAGYKILSEGGRVFESSPLILNTYSDR